MTTFENPDVDAGEAREALRGLAHATRSMDDPADVYDVLGSLSRATSALEQALHQIATVHDRLGSGHALVDGDPKAGQAASYRVSWELHRAGMIAHQIASAIDRAHEIEAQIAYYDGLPSTAYAPDRSEPTPGLSL